MILGMDGEGLLGEPLGEVLADGVGSAFDLEEGLAVGIVEGVVGVLADGGEHVLDDGVEFFGGRWGERHGKHGDLGKGFPAAARPQM